MTYKTFAKSYLDEVGAFDKDANYGGMLGESVMELVETFSGQGHSGNSADLTDTVFHALNRQYQSGKGKVWDAYWLSPEGQKLQADAGTPGILPALHAPEEKKV